jgi:Flp pilus assembly pilin Flp
MKKMLRKMASFFKRKNQKKQMFLSELGAVSSEYLLITALVSLVLIGVAIKYGHKIVNTLNGAETTISTDSNNLNQAAEQVNTNGF